MIEEHIIIIECEGDKLFGILHDSGQPSDQAMLVVVGGPQYRVGSHRQFVLLGRQVAARGIPLLRFDYRGRGDSEGEPRDFQSINTDIGCAIDALFRRLPAIRKVTIWGLCDAASAALFYIERNDSRVSGLILLNPWIRTEKGRAKAYLRHYYLTRFLDPALWARISRGEFRFFDAIRSCAGLFMTALGLRGMIVNKTNRADSKQPDQNELHAQGLAEFPERMLLGLQAFKGRILIILSADDLTAAEFRDTVTTSKQWRNLLARPNVDCRDFPQANHTFARRQWRDQLAEWTISWVVAG